MTAVPRTPVAVARVSATDRSLGHQSRDHHLRGRASCLGVCEGIGNALAPVGRRVACSVRCLRNAPWPLARHPRLVILVGVCETAAPWPTSAKLLRRPATTGRGRVDRSNRHRPLASRWHGTSRPAICFIVAGCCSCNSGVIATEIDSWVACRK